jgi:hypothetical protein
MLVSRVASKPVSAMASLEQDQHPEKTNRGSSRQHIAWTTMT